MSATTLTGPEARELRELVWALVDGPVQTVLASAESGEPVEPVDEEHVAALLRVAETLECAGTELVKASRRMQASAARLYEP